MNDNEIIIADSTALETVPAPESQTESPTMPATVAPITAAQARVDAVGAMLFKAYERASLLELSEGEAKALMADFPDDAFRTGADGKENLIYIEHANLRERLNQVIGIGRWSIITRRTWAEEFQSRDKRATRVYVEAVLVVRGCFAAEAIGDMVYYQANAAQNYGDAVEGAKSAALRRCAKELGVGLQAWKKEFAEGWMTRKLEAEEQVRETRRQQDRITPLPTAPVTPPPAAYTPKPEALKDQPPIDAAPPPHTPKYAQQLLEASKAKFLKLCAPILAQATLYGIDKGLILPTETIVDVNVANLFPTAIANMGQASTAFETAIAVDYSEHMEGIKRIVDDENQLPGAEVEPDATPEPERKPWDKGSKPARAQFPAEVPSDTKRLGITVEHVVAKSGKGANGKPWTRYGLVDSSKTWYNTFDKRMGELAMALKGKRAFIAFTTDQYGNTIVSIEPE